ncbi:MAG: T9SS C-terminal target domain-containing protein [Cytophagales bacterium]|nr:MAG: T9SS C-terminal target domain-containing protein [Cytophagales bacterium]
MKTYKLILLLLHLFINFSDAQTTLEYSVTPWLNNKRGALSLTFDDNIKGQYTTAIPTMNEPKYGFRGTFYTVTNWVPQSGIGSWVYLRDEVALKGHEIASHTVSHRNLSQLSDKEKADEIINSDMIIESNIPNIKCVSIAWPLGVGGQDAKVVAESNKRYIGGRNAWGAEWTNGEPHTAWMNSLTSKMNVLAFGISPQVNISQYTGYITGCLQYKWLVFFYHGIEEGEYDGPGKANFIKQMDAINAQKKNLWIAPFGEVMRYNAEKFSQSLKINSETDKEWILNLTDTLKDNDVYNHPLTLKVKNPTWKYDSITQNGRKVEHYVETGHVFFNAVPDVGKIIFHKNVISSIQTFNNKEEQFSIFPNPVKNKLNVVNIVKDVSYVITTITGNVVQNGVLTSDYIDIDNLTTGSYLIQFKTEKQKITRKFIKE